jgi:hypothetical protein
LCLLDRSKDVTRRRSAVVWLKYGDDHSELDGLAQPAITTGSMSRCFMGAPKVRDEVRTGLAKATFTATYGR